MHDLAQQPNVSLRYKAYEPGDLAGAFVVVAAATYEPELTEAIWHEAQQNNQLVNIVDVPARCNFIVPSILRRGQLTISVSTEGPVPAWQNVSASASKSSFRQNTQPICAWQRSRVPIYARAG
ncbi:hypothetical protein KDK_36540 [Dictyobacter kobayashii]|uniref:precorrin-2 dehydrogenase n=1 Tax=Dictyobacter kobayashii TaxID=2014872 RepID=A0A402ALG2_9CHLR|nr:hypothetical protein KDK_36540 [Dictyobacter kobayashii]